MLDIGSGLGISVSAQSSKFNRRFLYQEAMRGKFFCALPLFSIATMALEMNIGIEMEMERGGDGDN
jgi:hypothetical protein